MKNEKKHSNKVFSKYSKKSMLSLVTVLKLKPLRIGLILMVAMLLFITALEVFIPHEHGHHNANNVETKLSDSIETAVKSIASNFICNCGKCSRENLTICKCKNAVAERNTIRELLSKKILTSDIINVVNGKYGGLIKEQKQKRE